MHKLAQAEDECCEANSVVHLVFVQPLRVTLSVPLHPYCLQGSLTCRRLRYLSLSLQALRGLQRLTTQPAVPMLQSLGSSQRLFWQHLGGRHRPLRLPPAHTRWNSSRCVALAFMRTLFIHPFT